MSVSILRRAHGFQLDHIGLGVADTEQGVAWLRGKTGAEVYLQDPDPGQWYWSGALPIAEDSFLEVIGPNPSWSRFQPFRALLKTLDEPTILFWYIAVTSFADFEALARRHRAALERVECVNLDEASTALAAYTRGYVGPGFMTQRPNVIEWVRKPDWLLGKAPECRLSEFRLGHAEADDINRAFRGLGIDVEVARSPSAIGITLECPNGVVTLENAGVEFRGLGMLTSMLRLWWATR